MVISYEALFSEIDEISKFTSGISDRLKISPACVLIQPYHQLIDLYKKESHNVFNNIPTELILKFVQIIITAYDSEKKVFICANGGGVSAVENFVVDMNMHPFVSSTPPTNNWP